MTATFTVPELPGHDFTATLAASADAVVSSSGTQLLQFQIDNRDGLIKPGDYAEMHFAIPGAQGAVHVPATALMFRDQGMMVATVDRNNRVQAQSRHHPPRPGRQCRSRIAGVSPADRVIDNPPDALREGDLVKIADQRQQLNWRSHVSFRRACERRPSLRASLWLARKKPRRRPNMISRAASNQKFLADNAAKPGVFKTKDGLQYRVLKAGHGKSPQ